MPVVVTAAETPLGRLVVRRLVEDGAEVRAVVGEPTGDLGVPTAIATWDDPERLGAVLEGAHTVVHLAPRKRLDAVVEAAEDTSVVRLVVLGSPESRPPYEVVAVPDTRRRFRTPPAVLDALADALVEADRRR